MGKKTNEGQGREAAIDDISGSQEGGAHFGDLVWFSARQVDGVTRAEVNRLLVQADLQAYGLGPDQPSPWEALSKARGGWKRDRRPIQLDKERKDQRHSPWLITHKRARVYDPLACVSVDADTGDFLVEFIAAKPEVQRDPEHDDLAAVVVDELRDLYEAHFRHVSTAEVRAIVNEALLGCWGGTRLKEDGHLYWLPASSGKVEELRRLRDDVIGNIGTSYLRLLELADSSANRSTVADGALEAFEAEITSALREVRGDGAKFSADKSRESTFEDRIAAYEELRHRIDLYSDILGKRRQDLMADLDEATDIVTEMLSGASARREARRQRRVIQRAKEDGATDEELDELRARLAADARDDDAAADDDDDTDDTPAPTPTPGPAMTRSEKRRARRAAAEPEPDAEAAAANIASTLTAAMS